MSMSKNRLNQDEAFQKIMGRSADSEPEASSAGELVAVSAEVAEVETEATAQVTVVKPSKEKLIQTAFYITEKHRVALKMKAALSSRPEDKDQSSIVRAALDAYLADTIKDL